LTAIHYVHRLMAYLVFVAIALLVRSLLRVRPLRPQARWLAGLALLQLATGLGNVLLGWPLAAAVLHTGGAAALAVVLIWTLCESRRERATVAATAVGRRERMEAA
jgi:cytochrome c oxidase assembly protein subunit 15